MFTNLAQSFSVMAARGVGGNYLEYSFRFYDCLWNQNYSQKRHYLGEDPASMRAANIDQSPGDQITKQHILRRGCLHRHMCVLLSVCFSYIFSIPNSAGTGTRKAAPVVFPSWLATRKHLKPQKTVSCQNLNQVHWHARFK